MIARVGLSPLERRAEFAKAVELHETTKTGAAIALGVTWTHLEACLSGVRTPSAALRARVAEYIGMSVEQFWGSEQQSAAA